MRDPAAAASIVILELGDEHFSGDEGPLDPFDPEVATIFSGCIKLDPVEVDVVVYNCLRWLNLRISSLIFAPIISGTRETLVLTHDNKRCGITYRQ